MTDNVGSATGFGARLAERSADLVGRKIVDTRERLASLTKGVAMQVFTDATNHISDELRGEFGHVWRELAQHPDTDPALKPLLYNLGNSRGQAHAWVAGAVLGTAMGGGLGDVISNYLAEAVGYILSRNPRKALSVDAVVASVARGITNRVDPYYEVAKQGINRDRFDQLVDLTRHGPQNVEILEMLNRGILTKDSANTALRYNGVDPNWADPIIALAKARMSAPDMAAVWARSGATPEEVHAAAEFVGLSAQDAERFMLLAGEPPPLEMLIAAWRREIITEADVDRGIIQGPIRNEWIPTVKALQFQPLPPEEAAASVTQGHLTMEQALAKAKLSGITPEDFAIIVDNAGLPPGVQFAADAYNRGVIDLDTWKSMFLESRIKNKWIPVMEAMLPALIPVDTVRLLYRLKVYPRELAFATIKKHGYSDVDANAYLDGEDHRRHEATRDLSTAQTMSLYEEDLLTREQVVGMLSTLGWDAQEIDWQIGLANIRKAKKFIDAIVSRVGKAFIAGNMDEEVAAAIMDDAGLSPVARDRYLALWDLERMTASAQLTEAQITAALKRGLIDPDEARARYILKGHTEQDADILVTLALPAARTR